jgi:hypothetical protein
MAAVRVVTDAPASKRLFSIIFPKNFSFQISFATDFPNMAVILHNSIWKSNHLPKSLWMRLEIHARAGVVLPVLAIA